MLPNDLTYEISSHFASDYIYNFELFEKVVLLNKSWFNNFHNRNSIINAFVTSFYNTLPDFVDDIDYIFLKKITIKYPYILATMHSLRLYNDKQQIKKELDDFYNFYRDNNVQVNVLDFPHHNDADFYIDYENRHIETDYGLEHKYITYANKSKNYKFKFIYYLINEYIYMTLINNDVDVIKFMFKMLDYYKILPFLEEKMNNFSNISSLEIFGSDSNVILVDTLEYYLELLKQKAPRFFNNEFLDIFDFITHSENIACITYMLDNYDLRDNLNVNYIGEMTDYTLSFYTILNHPKFIEYKNIISSDKVALELFDENMSELDCELIHIFLYFTLVAKDRLFLFDDDEFKSTMSDIMFQHRQLFIHDEIDESKKKINTALKTLNDNIFNDARFPRQKIEEYLDTYITRSLSLVCIQNHTRKFIQWLWKLSENFDMYNRTDIKNMNIKMSSLSACLKHDDSHYENLLRHLILHESYVVVIYYIKGQLISGTLLNKCLIFRAKEYANSLGKSQIVDFIDNFINSLLK